MVFDATAHQELPVIENLQQGGVHSGLGQAPTGKGSVNGIVIFSSKGSTHRMVHFAAET
jgi:hypothetical protein